jgi:hypothetical protein
VNVSREPLYNRPQLLKKLKPKQNSLQQKLKTRLKMESLSRLFSKRKKQEKHPIQIQAIMRLKLKTGLKPNQLNNQCVMVRTEENVNQELLLNSLQIKRIFIKAKE